MPGSAAFRAASSGVGVLAARSKHHHRQGRAHLVNPTWPHSAARARAPSRLKGRVKEPGLREKDARLPSSSSCEQQGNTAAKCEQQRPGVQRIEILEL